MKWRRRALSPAITVVLTAGTLVALQSPASANVLSLSNFQLRPNAYGTDLQDRADALPLVKATVTTIMGDLNRTRDDGPPVTVGGACKPEAVASGSSPAIQRSLCFTDDDNETTQWYPQGVTTVADMQADQEWGDGHQPVLVSWYDANDNADGMVKGVRVSFMNRTTGSYRHVLLVYPKQSAGITSYDAVRVSQDSTADGYTTSLHAGGIVWYGNYLFVADTARGFRVFDMRRVFDLGASENGTTSGDHLIGYQQGTYYGYGYRYVMPQIGSWTHTAATGTKCSDNVGAEDGSPNFSYTSLDRSGTDHLIAGEYCAGDEDTNGRVATWPMAGAFSGGELVMDPDYRWNADAAYTLPVSNVQGATRFNNRWYLSQSDGATRAGWLHTAVPNVQPPAVTGPLQTTGKKALPIGPEDLSHWPGGSETSPTLGAVWSVSEHPGSDANGTGEGRRMVYAVTP
ncbi:hypothetical protein [Actinomadura rugatobispora]|uniref:Secreted protein n=1 Tax=Actinomadura rugatobispora TaxID=1994 RepID=A0ABW1A349_9ACTN|nr:hypothetical protein GCM10010200_039530 [Actinomadura rugatobispora]